MKFIGCFNKSVLLTYTGMLLSLWGILLLITGYDSTKDIKTSIIILIIAGLCDLFDGFIARKCKRNDIQKQFGIQIDSFADIISFGIYPCTILYYITIKSDNPRLEIIMITIVFYICATVTRLSWFNMITETLTENGKRYFRGVPVTYISLILPIIYITCKDNLNFSIILSIVMIIFAFFMIRDIKVPKPSGIWYVIFPLIAVTVLFILFTI